MSFKKHDRQYDIVVFGATGYTGLRTAEHIATEFPTSLRWAVAGRSEEKLRHVAKECRALNPDCAVPGIEVCNLSSADLAALVKKTFILITTVGPYAKYGELAFKACAEAGTHYFDCTGEAVWTMDMIEKYEATAKKTGACMFPQSGLESVPSDLLTFMMASHIRSELSAPTSDVVVGLQELRAAPSGGTLASAIGIFETYHWKKILKSHEPYALSPVTNTKLAPRPSLFTRLTGLYDIPNLGLFTKSVTSGADAAIVMRTWGLTKQEPELNGQFYGPNFTYREFKKARNFLNGMVFHYTLTVVGMLMTFCSPFRSLLRRFVPKPGNGPTREKSANEYVEFRGIATADLEKGPRKQALSRAWHTGSMYILTAKFLGQAARTLLQDDLPLKGGVYTPACLGQGYLERMEEQGFKTEVKIIDA